MPQAVLAAAQPPKDLRPDLSKQFKFPKPGAAPIELEQRRTPHTKEFLNPDGSFTVESHKEVIHYKDSRGKLVDIDNTLVAADETEYKYKNKSNSFKVKFAESNSSNKLVRVEADPERWLEFSPRGQVLSPGKAVGRSIKFSGGSPLIDYQYSVDANRLKEDIILHQYTGQNTFSFSLRKQGLTYAQNTDGTYSFLDKDGKSLYTFLKPWAEDMSGNVTLDATLEIVPGNDEDEIQITVDKEWLKTAAYPVVIDPVIEEDDSKINASDTFVASAYPSGNYYQLTYMHAGYYSSWGTTKSYVRWDALPSVPTGAKIDKVELSLYMYASVSGTTTTIEARNVTEPWVVDGITWSNQPTVAATPVPEPAITSTAIEYWNFDITSVGKGWYDGTTANNGVQLAATSDTATRRSFYTSNVSSSPPPVLKVTYTIDPLGTESFWGYAGNVNVHNGNLVVSATDLSLPGRGVPIAISRTYNSRAATTSSIYGHGWTYNVGMNLAYKDGSVVLLTDGDGTEYRFVKRLDGSYQPPVGVYMSLDKEGTLYVLEDLSGIKYYFNAFGKLSKVVDTEGAETSVSYTAPTVDGKPEYITDPSGRYVRFHYNTEGRLYKLYWKLDAASSEMAMVVYRYDTAGNLEAVEKSTDGYVGGTISIGFAYDTNHNLTKITDAEGKVTDIAYDAVADRVTTISKNITTADNIVDANGNLVTGAVSTTFAYAEPAAGETKLTVTDPRGLVTVYNTNARGNVADILRDDGNPDEAAWPKHTMTWDERQLLIAVKDPEGRETKMGYDATGEHLLQLESPDPEAGTAIYHYNSEGDVINSTDFAGRTSVQSYDPAKRRLLSSTNPLQATTATRYDSNGNVEAETAPLGLAENILANTGFEGWSNGLPNKWTKVSGTVSQESAEKVNGLYSAKLTGITTLRTVDYTPVMQKTKYALSWMVKADAVAAGGNARLTVQWYNSSKSLIGEELLQPVGTTSGWTRKQELVTAPDGAAYAQVAVMLDSSGTAWFDNVQMEPGSTVNAANLLTNESFEINTDSYAEVPDGWWDNSTLTTPDGVVSTTDRSGGTSNAVQITADAAARYVGLGVGAAGYAGTAVTFSGWSKATGMTGTGIYALRLRVSYADGSMEYLPVPFTKNDNTWEYVESTVVVPKDYTRLALFAWVENMTAGGKAWFDDLTLRYYGTGNALVSKYSPLQNGSFEVDANGDAWPDEWTNTHDPNVPGSYDVAWVASSGSLTPYSGNKVIRIQNVPSYVVIGNTVTEELKEAATYAFSAMAKTVGVTTGGAAIKIDILQGSQTLAQVQSDILTGTKDWTRLFASVSTEEIKREYAQADRIKFVVQTYGATDGTVYFDSVRAVEQAVETSYTYDDPATT